MTNSRRVEIAYISEDEVLGGCGNDVSAEGIGVVEGGDRCYE